MKSLIAFLLVFILVVPQSFATYSPFPGDVSTTTNEGVTSLNITPGPVDTEIVHIDAENISAEEAFMVIDLSDTTNWPHTNTGHIDILWIVINIDPDTTYAGDISLGFLTSVDATNGDFNGIAEIHLDKKTDPFSLAVPVGQFGLSLETAHWFGPTTANSTLFQTDVNLQGPDDATSYPSGAGDLVMIVGQTAGAVSVGLTIGYVTKT